ncbi:hypothetical protein DRQ16_04635 [bacterium]|nr:MAG: hypothetical protein DRQ16_04635 [bacterium]
MRLPAVLLLLFTVGCGRKEIKPPPPPPDERLLEILSSPSIKRGDLVYLFEKFLGKNLLHPFPDGKLHPEEPVNRVCFAIELLRIVVEHGLPAVPEDTIEIKDITPEFYAYLPVKLVVGSGLMELKNGLFLPFEPLSGADAVNSIKKLKELWEK